MKIEITVLISVLSAVVGMVTGVMAVQRGRGQDREKRSRETATIISEIGYVKAGIDDIKSKQEKQDERYYGLSARVTKLEAGLRVM